MKKLTKSVLAILVVASSFTACKKGEGDPAISLRSRASRVAGEWTVVDQETKSDYSSSSTGGIAITGSSSEKYTGTTYTKTNTSVGIAITSTGTVTDNSWTFEKTGTFKHTMNYTVKKIEDFSTPGFDVDKTETTTVYSVTEEGVWNFLGKVQEETKNKEEMSLSITKTNNVTTTTEVESYGEVGDPILVNTTTTTSTETSSDEPNANVMVWKLTTLKNKEMVVESVSKRTSNTNDVTTTTKPFGAGTSSSTSVTNSTTNMSFEAK